MSILSFFIPGDYTVLAILDTDEEYEVNFLDSENHDWQNDVTEFPVEDGAFISDNILVKPRRYRLSGITSDSAVSLIGVAQALSGDPETQKAVTFFENLRESQSLITVTSKMKTYESMACASVSISRSSGEGEAVRYNIDFKEVEIVASLTENLSAISGAARTATGALSRSGAGAAARQMGQQSASAATPAAASSGGSILASWLGIGA